MDRERFGNSQAMTRRPLRFALFILFAGALAAAAASAVQSVLPPFLSDSGKVAFAGVRSSAYGITPFPRPSEWRTAIETMAGYFPGSTPCAVWIVGTFKGPRTCRLYFPGDGRTYPHIEFDAADQHEEYLTAFDQAGIKVWLQVEPAEADLETLIDLVLGRYGRHECVIGFGVDVEWHREADRPGWGVKVDDDLARRWEARVKSFNPAYTLFLKHFDQRWMPPAYRGDIVFVDDSQIFKGFDEAVFEFVTSWAQRFFPNRVMFQIGYVSDKPWWTKLSVPPQTWGEAMRRRIKQDCGVIWVDFTLRDVLPLTVPPERTAAENDSGSEPVTGK
ncbi:MAG: hypothetical protein A2Y56_03265 [Candidatus Aminicenantes bacterium RBG_13_63_10]|nr:MAG: hypothetical protein A2Y56_03265 [Candidatus Aminicenantes bacterium RBG_13_63_10]